MSGFDNETQKIIWNYISFCSKNNIKVPLNIWRFWIALENANEFETNHSSFNSNDKGLEF